ncbi:MAG TPA: 6,7-dimethyl-8-ribityllumazine synthase [Terriglobales bacterium]|nr:6,7-dimethyl-8-ribityllumazine synthase [Terriglobales bacterium]
MIRSITTVRPTSSAADFEKLAALLDSLGFERGPGWNDGPDKGASFLAPKGNLEIFTGATGSGSAEYPDLLVEVSNLDDVHAAVKKANVGKVSHLTPTTWKSRTFKLEQGNFRVSFWAFDAPQRHAYQTVEGDLYVESAKFGIVVSRFNQFITDRLLQGALDALHRTGTRDADIEIVRVPGAFEVPIAAKTLAESKTKKVDAVICLGLLMRGETSNYEHIASEVARGIGQAAQDTGVPCTYGVLTCDTLEQAIDRAGLKMGNKGFEAAISAVEMVSLRRKLSAKK